MPEWIDNSHDFDDDLAYVEDLMRLAADDVPSPRSGLKVEIITHAQKTQRDIRRQQILWGGAVFVMLFLGGLVWWPASPVWALASNQESSSEPAISNPGPASDAIDWEHVEAESEFRRRNLEILRAAF